MYIYSLDIHIHIFRVVYISVRAFSVQHIFRVARVGFAHRVSVFAFRFGPPRTTTYLCHTHTHTPKTLGGGSFRNFPRSIFSRNSVASVCVCDRRATLVCLCACTSIFCPYIPNFALAPGSAAALDFLHTVCVPGKSQLGFHISKHSKLSLSRERRACSPNCGSHQLNLPHHSVGHRIACAWRTVASSQLIAKPRCRSHGIRRVSVGPCGSRFCLR